MELIRFLSVFEKFETLTSKQYGVVFDRLIFFSGLLVAWAPKPVFGVFGVFFTIVCSSTIFWPPDLPRVSKLVCVTKSTHVDIRP